MVESKMISTSIGPLAYKATLCIREHHGNHSSIDIVHQYSIEREKTMNEASEAITIKPQTSALRRRLCQAWLPAGKSEKRGTTI